jgi:hypothetical protein
MRHSASRNRDSHSRAGSSQKNTATETFSVAQTSMCSAALNRGIMLIPNGLRVAALISRMAARSWSGDIKEAPSIPMPPALETADTKFGIAMKAIPAAITGAANPYCSVMRVLNI